ncbi:hypothetical protein V0M98_32735 (plasmid) [Pseudomonas silesiensis]|uniref:hypothetical protein n=1 Tax=Pseudomonas silesiensis TaxID=1853130 RepID=UPI0030CE29CD
MKKSLNREELYAKDDNSMSWGDHQVWRLSRLMRLESSRLGIPIEQLRLGFHDKLKMELVGRHNDRVTYRPQGLITRLEVPKSDDETMRFDICWIDPWAFYHEKVALFTDIRFEVLDEFTFSRRQKIIQTARTAMMNKSRLTPTT